MARLIVKSPYIKGGGGGAGGYAKYIATRDGVELLPSGYIEYMAERPRSNGLFGDEDNVNLDATMKELNEYKQKSSSRDDLVRTARTQMKALVREMRQGIADHPEIESLMMTLSSQLDTMKGKKKYGYLPKDVKATVDEVINQMEKLPVVDDCYQSWWELQCQIENFYSEKDRQRPPLSEQKEFRSIKNAVIQEAENLRLNRITFEDEPIEQSAPDLSELPYDCWELWILTQDGTAPLAERNEAAAKLIEIAEGGDFHAQYLTGKLYLDGPVLIPDWLTAGYWFEQAAQQGYAVAQYELGKLLLTNDPEVRDPALGIQWLERAARSGNGHAAYWLGKEYLKGEIVEKDTAKAMTYLTRSVDAGNQYAQYALGKLHLENHDQEQAHYRFTQSAAQGNEYAQFFLDRWDSLKPPSVMLAATRLLHHMSRVFQDQTPSLPVPGGIQVDRKLMARIGEKKIAMGHKPNDHEEPSQGQMMHSAHRSGHRGRASAATLPCGNGQRSTEPQARQGTGCASPTATLTALRHSALG